MQVRPYGSCGIASPDRLECLDPSGMNQGVGISIDVEQIKGRQLF